MKRVSILRTPTVSRQVCNSRGSRWFCRSHAGILAGHVHDGEKRSVGGDDLRYRGTQPSIRGAWFGFPTIPKPICRKTLQAVVFRRNPPVVQGNASAPLAPRKCGKWAENRTNTANQREQTQARERMDYEIAPFSQLAFDHCAVRIVASGACCAGSKATPRSALTQRGV
jgi:hypothetical protein